MAKRATRTSRKKGSGIRAPHLIGLGAFAVAVLFAVATDLAKSETESILKRHGYWPTS